MCQSLGIPMPKFSISTELPFPTTLIFETLKGIDLVSHVISFNSLIIAIITKIPNIANIAMAAMMTMAT